MALCLSWTSWACKKNRRFNSEQLINQPIIWLTDRTCYYTMLYTMMEKSETNNISPTYVHRKHNNIIMHVHNAISGPPSKK